MGKRPHRAAVRAASERTASLSISLSIRICSGGWSAALCPFRGRACPGRLRL